MNTPKKLSHNNPSAPADLAAIAVDTTALLHRLQAGDAAAFEQLVRENGGRMLATARRFFQNEHDAADAVQDAFISAFKAIKTFKGESQLGTWLHRIVVNCCLMRRRSNDRRTTVAIESLLPQFDASGHHIHPVNSIHNSPYEALASDETRQQVRQCIERLPAPYREVIVMRDIEDFDTETTAQMLAVSTAVVKTRLHRARQALCTLLKPGFDQAV